MRDPRVVADILRPKIAGLAEELAPVVLREAAKSDSPGFFEGSLLITLEGVFSHEMRLALDAIAGAGPRRR